VRVTKLKHRHTKLCFHKANFVFWDVTPCGSCKNRRFGELSASIRMTRIGEVGTTLAVTSNRRMLVFLRSVRRLLVTAPPKRRFLREPNDVTSQKTPFFIVTAVKSSNLTWANFIFKENEIGIRLKVRIDITVECRRIRISKCRHC
jgi:hypothetical protein